MLLVLVYMATLSQVPAYGFYRQHGCPVSFYGNSYNSTYVNITSTEVAVCFKGYYPVTQENDCIVTPRGQIAQVSVQESSNRKDPGSNYHQAVPGLVGSSTCAFIFICTSSRGTRLVTVATRDFGKQYIALIHNFDSNPMNVTDVIDGVSQVNMIPSGIHFRNTGACRQSGAVYKVNTTTCLSNGSSVTCSSFSEVTVSHSGEVCNPRVPCTEPLHCTVTGSTVINFFGNATSIQDHCAYTLISHSGVRLLAVFKDRRRKDVSLLENVILHLDGLAVINLAQGGRVQLNDRMLNLSSSPLSHYGVEFSKDQTGVTAKFTLSNCSASVFFDGYTVQIHMRGKANITGLCGNSSRSEVRTQYSSSCGINYSEPADRSINCTRMTERCNLIREAPFTTCHNHIDPEPFITACTNTLCRYPMVDGLSQCNFLEAYGRACNFKTNDTLEGWRSMAGCFAPQAFCQDTICSAHEFCAEDISGGTNCFCRAIFASKYRSTGALGEPTVCDQNSASVSLVGCLLKEKGIDYTQLHLNNQSCRGQMDNVTQMVTFKFNAANPCGTVVMANSSSIIYKNSIMAQNGTNNITRYDQVNIDFSCFYNQPDIKSVAFNIRDSSVIQQIVSGAWNYSLTMKVYSDAGHTRVIEPNTAVKLQQTVYVELKTDGLDGKLIAVVIDSCWATNEESPKATLRYYLIVDGCSNPIDKTVKMVDNGLGTSNYFSFNVFEFSGKSSDVYLHCKVKLCVKKGNPCTQSCGGKRGRRSVRPRYEDGNPALITMAWTK